MAWEESGGTSATVVGKEFVPSSEDFFYFAAVRTWISSTEVTVDYVINGIHLGRETVAEGDIGKGTGGTFIVGARGAGAAAYDQFLPDGSVIDSLSIENDAMSVEELVQDFKMATLHEPSGYKILRSYIPPGDAYSKDPESRVQRWIAAEGVAIGHAIGLAEALRDDFLPDRAYGENLAAWERVTGKTPDVNATIAERRAAVLAHLQDYPSLSVADIKEELEVSLGLDSADIDLYEFDGERSDDFSTDDISSPPSNLWATHQGNGAVAIASGSCNITATAGDNITWWHHLGGKAAYRETSLSSRGGGSYEGAHIDIEVIANAGHGNNSLAGVFVRNNPGDEYLFFGLLDTGSGFELYYVSHAQTLETIGTVSPANEAQVFITLRIDGAYDVGYINGSGERVVGDEVEGPTVPGWMGFGCFGTDRSPGDSDASFDNAHVFERHSPRGHQFIVYRDSSLSGAYNLREARALIEKLKPAHTEGYVLDDTQGFKLGTGLLGLSPLHPRI